jgi:hypothetical protein
MLATTASLIGKPETDNPKSQLTQLKQLIPMIQMKLMGPLDIYMYRGYMLFIVYLLYILEPHAKVFTIAAMEALKAN